MIAALLCKPIATEIGTKELFATGDKADQNVVD